MVEKKGGKESRVSVSEATLYPREVKERRIWSNFPQLEEGFFKEAPKHACKSDRALLRDKGRGRFFGDREGDRRIPVTRCKTAQDTEVEKAFEAVEERGPWCPLSIISRSTPSHERLGEKRNYTDVKAIKSTILGR
jgi:hypothetical protein